MPLDGCAQKKTVDSVHTAECEYHARGSVSLEIREKARLQEQINPFLRRAV